MTFVVAGKHAVRKDLIEAVSCYLNEVTIHTASKAYTIYCDNFQKAYDLQLKILSELGQEE